MRRMSDARGKDEFNLAWVAVEREDDDCMEGSYGKGI